ncbi:MAG: DEAD/DEAH box helicase, partial [Povalibacter sp.]
GFKRPVELADARVALARLQSSLELGKTPAITAETKQTIAGYNCDDCVSAFKLRNWLESIRSDLISKGATIERPTPQDEAPTEELDERQRKVQALAAQLLKGVPDDKQLRTPEQHARWIMANTLDFHRREDKSAWWEFFRLAALPPEDLLEERDAIAGLEFVECVGGGTKAAPIHRYRFPAQDIDLRGGESLHMPGEAKLGTVEAISFETRTIDIKKRKDTAGVHPSAAFAHDMVNARELAGALLRIGEEIAARGMEASNAYAPARNLLLRRPPSLNGEPLQLEGELAVAAAIRVVRSLHGGILPIQGPPGAGKTFTAARMICALVQDGKKVGITANSHKVIRNLLNEVGRFADESGLTLQCIQKVKEETDDLPRIVFTTDNAEALAAIQSSKCQVAAGTAWFWSREDAFECVDVLFVDEAAQMALANVLAVSQACRTLVLLGDPQQLEQPTKGTHPEGTEVSALDHLLHGKSTIGAGEGLFLEETWRLHPDVCAFTSELFYENRLHSRQGLERQTITSQGRINGTGLRLLAVEHEGNQGSSPEEADVIKDLVTEILASNSRWTDRNGTECTVGLDDILIIAPYNAQVFELQSRMPGARIGTVDKFQGQEAPIVIYSMTTSSHADAPRGMEFLYSLNRLNVATSRAKCICVLVASPKVFEPECKSPRQMQLANAFCRYVEMATRI